MNFVLAAGNVNDVPFALTHLWSLAAEEQFYLLWPLILLLVFRARVGLAIAACTAGVLLTQLRALELVTAHANGPRIAFGIDTRSLPIIAGCLLALVWSTRARGAITRRANRFEPVAVALFLALVLSGWGNLYFAGPLLIVAACSCVLIIRAFDHESTLTRALSLAPMVFLGRISYSLYLWHVPVLVTFGVFGAGLTLVAIPAVGLAVIAAIASYYLVESPLRRRARHPVQRPRARSESPSFPRLATDVRQQGVPTTSA
jgi:peptidoglycan/LPS O-acetylase OafA/YrhL